MPGPDGVTEGTLPAEPDALLAPEPVARVPVLPAWACPAACARAEKPLLSETRVGDPGEPEPMAGRPGTLVRPATSLLICIAELSAPAMLEPPEVAAPAAEPDEVKVPSMNVFEGTSGTLGIDGCAPGQPLLARRASDCQGKPVGEPAGQTREDPSAR